MVARPGSVHGPMKSGTVPRGMAFILSATVAVRRFTSRTVRVQMPLGGAANRRYDRVWVPPSGAWLLLCHTVVTGVLTITLAP